MDHYRVVGWSVWFKHVRASSWGSAEEALAAADQYRETRQLAADLGVRGLGLSPRK